MAAWIDPRKPPEDAHANQEMEHASRGTRALVAILASCLMSNAGETARADDGSYPAASTGIQLKTAKGNEGSEHLSVLDVAQADL